MTDRARENPGIGPDLSGREGGLLRHYDSYEQLRVASEDHVLKCMGDEPLGIGRAEGVDVLAADGTHYLDAISGEWVVNLGYNHPAIRAAVDHQLGAVEYTTPVWESEPRTRYAERLVQIAPGDISKVLYALSGAGAVEGAMHLAMRRTGGTDFVCLDGAFHGRTFGTIPLTYVYPAMYEESNRGLDSYLKRQIRVPQYNCYRCPLGLERSSCGLACADAVDWALERAHTHKPAGVIVEPFQANGGMVPAPRGYLKKVKGICEKHEVPLVADEVQSAFCRCGPMFACQRPENDVDPDLIVLGKAMGGGFPLSATLATEECSRLGGWEYGFTMAGHPISCAAGLAMTETMVAEELSEHSERMGTVLLARLRELASQSRLIGDVRGQGLMVGVELVLDPETKQPASAEAARVVEAALERGLMIGRSGPVFGELGNVLKMKPAVNVPLERLEGMLERFESALATVEREL